jgi:hypothetical protein
MKSFQQIMAEKKNKTPPIVISNNQSIQPLNQPNTQLSSQQSISQNVPQTSPQLLSPQHPRLQQRQIHTEPSIRVPKVPLKHPQQHHQLNHQHHQQHHQQQHKQVPRIGTTQAKPKLSSNVVVPSLIVSAASPAADSEEALRLECLKAKNKSARKLQEQPTPHDLIHTPQVPAERAAPALTSGRPDSALTGIRLLSNRGDVGRSQGIKRSAPQETVDVRKETLRNVRPDASAVDDAAKANVPLRLNRQVCLYTQNFSTPFHF